MELRVPLLALALVACGAPTPLPEGATRPRVPAEASRVEAVNLASLAPGERLFLHGAAAVVARAGDAPPRAEARLTLRGRDRTEAAARLSRTALVLERVPAGWSLGPREAAPTEAEVRPGLSPGLPPGLPPLAELVLELPPGLDLEVRSLEGGVRLEGPFGAVSIQSSGAVSATGGRGPLAVRTAGPVEVSDHAGASLEVRAERGAITLRGIHSDVVTLAAGLAELQLEDVAARVSAATESGTIQAAKLSGGPHRLRAGGGIAVHSSQGELELTSLGGALEVSAHEGTLHAKTGRGDVAVRGRFDAVWIETERGSVELFVFPGSRVSADWWIESDEGPITLHLPPDLAATVDAATAAGWIDFQSGVRHNLGQRQSGPVRAGWGGEGGGLITLRTYKGDVRVLRAEEPEIGEGEKEE